MWACLVFALDRIDMFEREEDRREEGGVNLDSLVMLNAMLCQRTRDVSFARARSLAHRAGLEEINPGEVDQESMGHMKISKEQSPRWTEGTEGRRVEREGWR